MNVLDGSFAEFTVTRTLAGRPAHVLSVWLPALQINICVPARRSYRSMSSL